MLSIPRFDLAQYHDVLKKLEERYEDLYEKSLHNRYDFDVAQRLCLLEQEINDLYDIISYLSSSVPRSEIFIDIVSRV